MVVVTIGAGTALLGDGSTPSTPEPGSPDPGVIEVEQGASPEADLGAIGQTRALPPAPIPPRTQAQIAWSGEEVLVWSGSGTAASEGSGESAPVEFSLVEAGAAYTPGSDSWRPLPPAPLAPRVGAAAVWAGDRLVVWGGFAGPNNPLGDGAAYVREQDAWVTIPPAPISPRGDMVTAWTGEEVLLLGGGQRTQRPWGTTLGVQRDGAAYNPATDRWRMLPPLPPEVWPIHQRVVGTWTAGQLFVWGSGAARYDPGADGWELIDTPSAGLWPGGRVQAVQVGDSVAVVGLVLSGDPDTFGLLYEPGTDDFDRVPGLPRTAMTRERQVVGAGDYLTLFLDDPADAGAWRLGDDAWQSLPPELARRTGSAMVWTGQELVVWGGSDGQTPWADGLAWTP